LFIAFAAFQHFAFAFVTDRVPQILIVKRLNTRLLPFQFGLELIPEALSCLFAAERGLGLIVNDDGRRFLTSLAVSPASEWGEYQKYRQYQAENDPPFTRPPLRIIKSIVFEYVDIHGVTTPRPRRETATKEIATPNGLQPSRYSMNLLDINFSKKFASDGGPTRNFSTAVRASKLAVDNRRDMADNIAPAIAYRHRGDVRQVVNV